MNTISICSSSEDKASRLHGHCHLAMFCNPQPVQLATHSAQTVAVVTTEEHHSDTLPEIRRSRFGTNCSDPWPEIRAGTSQSRHQRNHRCAGTQDHHEGSPACLAGRNRTIPRGRSLSLRSGKHLKHETVRSRSKALLR